MGALSRRGEGEEGGPGWRGGGGGRKTRSDVAVLCSAVFSGSPEETLSLKKYFN